MDYTGNLPCDIADVVELLGIRVVRNTGTQLHCKCPFCDDRKAHLNINLGKNVFRCNRCGKGGRCIAPLCRGEWHQLERRI